MSKIEVRTNNVPRFTIDRWDLTEKESKEFDYLKLFNLVRSEFNEELAIAAVVAHTVHLGMKIKMKDMQEAGRFVKRLRANVAQALWETPELYDQALEVALTLYTYETCQTLQGPGGCVAKTLKQCIEEHQNDQP